VHHPPLKTSKYQSEEHSKLVVKGLWDMGGINSKVKKNALPEEL
jgi:hypothetical protein